MSIATDEAEVTAVHAPGTDIARFAPSPVPEEYRARFVMAPEEAAALDRQLRECMRAVLVENVDYGLIPGMGKTPSLFKPGAEKLLQWFGFGFENRRDEIERDSDGKRIGVTYRCTVFKELADGRRVTVATCEGYAGYDEDKFYVSAEAARAKAEEKERMWAKKDGRNPNSAKWENAAEYRAPWNSMLKMAHKRALVGAAIDATAAAGLFTQDLEDLKGQGADGGNAFTDAASAKIMALPEDARNALDQWYRGKRWPDPSQWTPEQWCDALVAAGTIAARQTRQPAAQAGQPAKAEAAKPDAPAGEPPQPLPPLDPDDPWLLAIRDIATPEDAEKMRGELDSVFAGKPEAAKRAAALSAALAERAEAVRQAAAAAGTGGATGSLRVQIDGAADETAIRNLRVRIGKAVAAKEITPAEANELGDALRERAGQIRGAA